MVAWRCGLWSPVCFEHVSVWPGGICLCFAEPCAGLFMGHS